MDNIPTEVVIDTLLARGVSVGAEPGKLAELIAATNQIRVQYGR